MRTNFKIGSARIDVHGYKHRLLRDEDFGCVRFLYIQITKPVKGQNAAAHQWTLRWSTPERSKEYRYEGKWTLVPTFTMSKPKYSRGFRMSFKWLRWELPLWDMWDSYCLDPVLAFDQDASVEEYV